MSWLVRLAVVAAFLSPLLTRGQVLTTAEAKDHVGETSTVCGTIASETTATGSRLQGNALIELGCLARVRPHKRPWRRRSLSPKPEFGYGRLADFSLDTTTPSS